MSTNENSAIAQLKKQIADGTEQTKSYLSSLQESIKNYDKEHKLLETASSYMQAGIDQANWSVNELKDFGNRFQEESKDVSDELVKSARNALNNVNSSLEGLKSKASDFDNKSRTNVAQGAEHAKQKAAHGAEKTKQNVADGAESARSSLADLVNSACNQGSSFFESISTSLDNLQKQVAAGASNAGNAVSNTASNATTAVSNAATTAKDKVAETDQNVSGGMGADIYNKTAELVNQGVEYVSSAFSSDDKPTDPKP